MQAVSRRLRGTKTGSPTPRNSSQCCAPARIAFAGASVTRTAWTFVAAARPAETLRCCQIGYSVMRTLAPECLRSCQCSYGETCVLQCFGQRMSSFLEIAIGEAFLLALAVGLDQTHFVCELIQRVLESFADGLVFGEVQHYRRD